MAVDRDECYSTAEMHDELVAEGTDITYDEVADLFAELESEGVAEHVGETDDGEDLWTLQSPLAAARLVAAKKAVATVQTYRDRFLGGEK